MTALWPSHLLERPAPPTTRSRAPSPMLLSAATARSGLAASARRMRRIHGADGAAWDVIEQVSATPLHGHSRYSLVFMSPESVRRVRTYPSNWCELSDAELETLSWRV